MKANTKLVRECGAGVGFVVLLVLLTVPGIAAGSPFGRGGRGAQGYLGINFRDVGDEQIGLLKLKDAHGEEVILVDHDGPACKAGLREHDVLLQVNGQVIEGEEQLRRTLREMPAGRQLLFAISREGQALTITVQLANRETVEQEAWGRHITVPEPSASESATRGFFAGGGPTTADLPRHGLFGATILNASYTGALLEVMGPQLADYFGAQGGLLVRAVTPDSPAAVAGMRAGDVVVKLNAMPVVSGADWLKTIHDSKGHALSVSVLRDRKEQVLTLTPDSKKRSRVTLPGWPGHEHAPEPAVGMLTFPGPVV